MHAHHEQRKQQQHHPMLRKTDTGHDHDRDFQPFDALEDARLVEALAQLARKPGEHHERQDEQAGREVRQQFRTQSAPAGRLISHEDDQHVLEKIVVKRAASLGYEEWQEAPLAQESELVGFAHDFKWPRSRPRSSAGTGMRCSRSATGFLSSIRPSVVGYGARVASKNASLR